MDGIAPGATLGPQQRVLDFVGAINDGDLRAALDLFGEDPRLVTPDATVLEGRDEVRTVLAQLTARGTQIEVRASAFLVSGRVALGSERWAMRHAAADEEGFERITTAVTVLHRAGAIWKLAIAAPWGWGQSPAPSPAPG